MSELGETPGNRVIRLGIEHRISDFYEAGDMVQVNANLDVWPYNHVRSLGGVVVEQDTQITDEFPAIDEELIP